MTIASGILAIWSIFWAGDERKSIFAFKPKFILWGVLSAAVLYLIFWLGNIISIQLFPFASGQINAVYANKLQLQNWQIALLLLFWIGPAEEIFWRGMSQRVFSKYFGANTGWVFGAFVYAVVHIWSLNLILIMAALIGGLYWGWIYKRLGSLWPGIISHALWDIAIFLIFPLQ